MFDGSFVRRLAAWHSESPVTSLYLDVDGSRAPRWADVERRLSHLLHEARHAAAVGEPDGPRGAGGAPGAGTNVTADLDAIRGWVSRGLDRSTTLGVAVFSCAGDGLFEAVELPTAVRDQVVVDHSPDVAQLCEVLATSWEAIAAAVDRRRARLVRVGPDHDVVEVDLLDDVIPRQADTDLELAGFDHHEEELVREHYRRISRRLATESARTPSAHLVLLGPDESVAAVAHALTPDATARLSGQAHAEVAAGASELAEVARAVVEQAERERRDALRTVLADRAATGTQAVRGVDATLRALGEGRAATVVVERSYEAPGGRCIVCGLLVARDTAADGDAGAGTCPRCGGTIRTTPNVVDAAIADAFVHGIVIEPVEDGTLSNLGRIGALLSRSVTTANREVVDA